MKELINRNGFDGWAGNIIVNYIEDYGDIVRNSHVGSHSIEKQDYNLNAKWELGSLDISIRAYVEGDGWQTLEQNIKIK